MAGASFGCGDEERPPPAGFGNAPGEPEGGQSGSASGGRGGTLGRTGGAGGTRGGEAGSTGSGGDGSGDGGDGAEAGSGSASGGRGGEGDGNPGGVGANGGGGNETASGGALVMPPDLDCKKSTPSEPATPPLCDPKAKWGDSVAALASPSGADALLSVTPNELSLVFRYQDALAPTTWVVDRPSVDDDFGTPELLEDEMLAAATQLALAPSGLRLIAVLDQQFTEFVRASPAEPFAYAGPGYFELIDADAGSRNLELSDPVLGADDVTLFYSASNGDVPSGPTLHVSRRSGHGNWPVGEPLDECELNRASTGLRRPTGISADSRTLFYYDEPRAMQRAAWRPSEAQPFDRFVDTPDRFSAQPTAACDRLYFSAPSSSGVQIFFADQE